MMFIPQVIQSNASARFLGFLQEVKAHNSSAWNLAIIRTRLLLPLQPLQISQALAPILSDVHTPTVYRMDDGDLYITWKGDSSDVLRGFMTWTSGLMRPDIDPILSPAVSYSDPRSLSPGEFSAKTYNNSGDPTRALRPLDQDALRHFDALSKARGARKRPLALVVEDVDFSRKLLESFLVGHFGVITATDAHAGWDAFRDHAPDIVFLDIELPGINGHDLAEKIWDMQRGTFIVMVTGRNTLTDLDRARANGATAFIVKPYSKQKITECIDRFRARRNKESINERGLRP